MRRKKQAESCSNRDEDSGSGMMVAVRIRPLSTKEINAGHKSCCTALNGNTIAIKKEGNAAMYLKSQQGSVNEYCFDSVFDTTSSQYEVYEKTTKRFIKDVIDGYNVTVFAYGATGAGKTHTMMGNARVDESDASLMEAGIIPNALSDVFKIISAKRMTALPGQQWKVIASFMEVYNEQVYDLLESTDKVLSVREDTERGVVEVAGRTKTTVNSANEVLDLLQLGNTNRKTEATMANQVSSRSHAVLQLTIEYSSRNSCGQEVFISSTLSLIDLAGSERASATNNRGSRLQEGANINKSLLALANCINALAGNSTSGKQHNVKYRDSKLTHMLKSSLQGKCKLVMIANINPSHITFEDSHNSLKYANRAKNIKVNPLVVSEVNKDSNWVEREMKLKTENAELRARIAELEAIVESLQRRNTSKPTDFDFKDQDEVVGCSLESSIINNSIGDVSLPSICDIPSIKSSKSPRNSYVKRTPFSEKQKYTCDESQEIPDAVDLACSDIKIRSFSSDYDGENMTFSRSSNVEDIKKKRGVETRNSTHERSKRVKLEPMGTSLKDRIAELSKITSEQQKMFNELLQDQIFVDQIANSDDVIASQKNHTMHLSSATESDGVCLSDIVIEEKRLNSNNKVPLIYCDDNEKSNDPTENVPRKRRRNSLIPKRSSETEKSQTPLTDIDANAAPDHNNNGGLLMKVMKNVPLTRAAKKRMSLAGSQMSENQPVGSVRKDTKTRRESLKPLPSTSRRNSTATATKRGLRNL